MKFNTPKIKDVHLIPVSGPWKTKSDGKLSVLFNLDKMFIDQFFSYSADELKVSKTDIRGLRSYKISDLNQSSIGGREWHKIRNEIVSVTRGKVLWKLQDTTGATIEHTLTPLTSSLFIPSYIMHTYVVLEDETEISVTTNTLYLAENKNTHDTYPESSFPLL